jgi:hypothetical protein
MSILIAAMVCNSQSVLADEAKSQCKIMGSPYCNSEKVIPVTKSATSTNSGIRVETLIEYQARQHNGRVTLDVFGAPGVTTATLANTLRTLNAEVTVPDPRVISRIASFTRQQPPALASITLSQDQLAALENNAAIQFAVPSLATTHAVISQGDRAQGSDVVRTWSLTGAGFKVGILSDSFACVDDPAVAGDSYAEGIANGELPSEGVTILAEGSCIEYDDEGNPISTMTDEGRAIGEIIHDVAPGAALGFYTAFNGISGFVNGIYDLAVGFGADIIVDDVLYYTEPMFQDGFIAQMAQAATADGIHYFSSAGNNGRNAYAAPFADSGIAYEYSNEAGDLWTTRAHDFDPSTAGVDPLLNFILPANRQLTIVLQWSDPFYSVSLDGATRDLDLCLRDTAGNLIFCAMYPNVGGDPLEGFVLTGLDEDIELTLSIEYYGGPTNNRGEPIFPEQMKVVFFGARVLDFVDQYAGINAGTIYGHANAAGVNAVGAVSYDLTPAFGMNPPQLNYYSSAGTTPIYYATNGARIPVEMRDKPTFSAPDCANTSFFYPGQDIEPDGIPNFCGTSAAAPHAAGAAALLLELNSWMGLTALTPTALTGIFQDSATDINTRLGTDWATPIATFAAGYDHDSGAGLIDAVEAFNLVYSPPVRDCDVDADGDIDRIDLRQLLWLRNQPAAANPAADANHDEMIDMADYRLCRTRLD